MTDNPLLDFSGLPRFADITPAHVGPAMDRLLADGRAAMAAAESAPPTWDAFVRPLEDATERLSRAWVRSSTCTPCSTARRCARRTTRACPR